LQTQRKRAPRYKREVVGGFPQHNFIIQLQRYR